MRGVTGLGINGTVGVATAWGGWWASCDRRKKTPPDLSLPTRFSLLLLLAWFLLVRASEEREATGARRDRPVSPVDPGQVLVCTVYYVEAGRRAI